MKPPSSIKFLNKMRKKNTEVITKEISHGYLKDALLTQIQPVYSGKEILDIEFTGVQDPIAVKIYLKKEVRKKSG